MMRWRIYLSFTFPSWLPTGSTSRCSRWSTSLSFLQWWIYIGFVGVELALPLIRSLQIAVACPFRQYYWILLGIVYGQETPSIGQEEQPLIIGSQFPAGDYKLRNYLWNTIDSHGRPTTWSLYHINYLYVNIAGPNKFYYSGKPLQWIHTRRLKVPALLKSPKRWIPKHQADFSSIFGKYF